MRIRPMLVFVPLGAALLVLTGAVSAQPPTQVPTQVPTQLPTQVPAQALAQSAARPPASGSTVARELLNSERIEATFGSYRIDVLESSPRLRVSNLQSIEPGGLVCRTFAVVRYPEAVAPELAAEHAAILAGGSIGAVFTASGWRVVKTHLHFGTLPAGARAAKLMQVDAGTPLATHVYLLAVEKGGRSFPYAAIAELHHPDYLTAADLATFYGTAAAGRDEALLETVLETASREAAGP